MFLRTLKVEHSGRIVREVTFKNGLNLIIDETASSGTTSGNNVGKTTLMRVVDYCLGGKIDRIYTDKETKTVNKDVEEFLQDLNTKITLTLGRDHEEHVIERVYGQPTILDGEERGEEAFREELGYILFKLRTGKPSLRQVLNKFIRIESYQVENIFKFMYPSTGAEVYESIFLYLFGFSDNRLIKDKDTYNKKLKKLSKQKTGLSSTSKGALRQMIRSIEREMKKVEKKIENFQTIDSVKKETEELEQIRATISELSISLSGIRTRLSLGRETLANLKDSRENIDPSMVREVYDSAKLLVPEIQRKFEDVLEFHNGMIANKIQFVEKNLEKLSGKIEQTEKAITQHTVRERELLSSISKQGALEDFRKLNNDLGELKERRGERVGILGEIEKVDAQIKTTKKSLAEVNKSLAEFQDSLDKELEIFNKYYTEISNELYGEQFVLSYDINDRDIYEFNVTAMRGAIGAGKKKGYITAFDLAYLKYLEKKMAGTCRFQLNDRLEEVSINQLATAFKIANEIDGQFVVAILQDKISSLGEDFIHENEVSRLSEKDKFFRLS